jgi:hypothetical protein
MAHPDLDELLNALLPLARTMLAKHGEFYPYGSAMKANGEIVAVAAYDGDETPPSQPLIDILCREFRDQAREGAIRAAGVCYDVRTIPPGQGEKTDAICCDLEHCSGQSIATFLPYKKGSSGEIIYGVIFATRKSMKFLHSQTP